MANSAASIDARLGSIRRLAFLLLVAALPTTIPSIAESIAPSTEMELMGDDYEEYVVANERRPAQRGTVGARAANPVASGRGFGFSLGARPASGHRLSNGLLAPLTC